MPVFVDDELAGAPPLSIGYGAPDLASLQFPWDAAPAPVEAPPVVEPELQQVAALQPGIGISTAALDAAVEPAPVAAAPIDVPAPPAADPAINIPPPGESATPIADAASSILDSFRPEGESIAPEMLDTSPTTLAEQLADQWQRDPLKNPDSEEAVRQLEELLRDHPGEFAALAEKVRVDREQMVAAQRREDADRDRARMERNYEDRKRRDDASRAKTEALIADSQRLADTKIDPSGGVHGARHVAGVIAAIIGGLVQSRTGAARNAGLDALNETINRGIEAQKADIASQREGISVRRGALAEEYARSGDMFEAEEKVRLGALKHAADVLATRELEFAAGSMSRLRIAAARVDVEQNIAQRTAAFDQAQQQKDFDNTLKLTEVDQKQRAEERAAAIAEANAQNQRAQIGLGYAGLQSAAEDRLLAREQRRDDKEIDRRDKEEERDRQFAVGGVPHVVIGPDGKPVTGPDGGLVVSRDKLRNADGHTWRAPSPEREKEISEKTVATRQLVKLYDRALALRDRVGGESGTFNSNEYQELKSIEAEIKLLRKQGTQGMSSDADMENLAEAGGAKDLTSFRARAAGLKAARARIVDNLNETYRTAKYTGPDLVFPESAPTTNTPEEERTKSLLEPTNITFDQALKVNLDEVVAERGYGIDITDPNDQRLYQQVAAETRETFDPRSTAKQRADVGQLGRAALGKGDEATKALATLREIATKSSSPRMRQLAQSELDAAAPKPTPRGPASEPVSIPDALRIE